MSILKLISFQGNVKGHVFQKQAWIPLIFMFYFDFLSKDDSVCKKLEKKLNHNFNYTHTSLNNDVIICRAADLPPRFRAQPHETL